MEIHQLKIFISVYENKSFTLASKQLRISQPTISEHIKNLEKSCQCRLFDRMGRTILPTKEAGILYPRAMQILGDLENLEKEILAAGDSIKGLVKIGASTIPGAYILPSMAMDFKKKHPEISFEILIEDSARVTAMVLNHELLCGIVGAVMEESRLDSVSFVEDELILAATDKIIANKKISKDQLYEIPFIQREDGSGTRRSMESSLFQAGIEHHKLNVVAVLGSSTAVKEALKAGLGVSILSRFAIAGELQSGQLKKISVPGLKMKRQFFLIRHKKRTLPPAYQLFWQHLLEQ